MPRRTSKLDSAIVQRKWKNKHSTHINNNRIKQGYYGRLRYLEPSAKWTKKREKKKMRISYHNLTQQCELSVEEVIPLSHHNDLDAYIDEYQDIPIWNCPLCSYANIERHLLCSICDHPYSRKPQTIAISHYIKYPKRRIKSSTKSSNTITAECIKDIISAKTGLPHNKIHVNPLLNKHAMTRLLRKYYQYRDEISLVYSRNEIIPDDNNERFFDGWRCQYCGQKNPKIYVFCEECFLAPHPQIIKTPQPIAKNLFVEEMALDDLIVDFCGLRALVYGYCDIYTQHKLNKDIIGLIDAYYRSYMRSAVGHAVLPFNQHDLSECNEFAVYCDKRETKLSCYPLEQFAEYIGKMNKRCRKYRDLYICLLLIKSDNKWPKATSFRNVLPIYKVKFKKGMLCCWHQFCDSKDSVN